MAREPSEPGQEIGCERVESLARIFSVIDRLEASATYGFVAQISLALIEAGGLDREKIS
jgi:hypothetical protein